VERRPDKVIVSIFLVLSISTVCMSLVLANGGDDDIEGAGSVGFYGYITSTSGGSGVEDAKVEIKRGGIVWKDTTDDNGYYETKYPQVSDMSGNYQLFINDELCEQKSIKSSDFTNEFDSTYAYGWDYAGDYEIPEFSTIAIPVAIVFGIVFFIRRKK